MKRLSAVFLGGVVFALGLGVSGMTDANKVIGFLNLAGTWDPSLAFVMLGAIGVHLGFYRHILRRQSPMFDTQFYIPTRRDITPRLVGGAALFGVGWGIGGICPGSALVSLAGFGAPAGIFAISMLVGMLLEKRMHQADMAPPKKEKVPC